MFAVFASEGLDFVPKVKDAFPREASEKLASDTLLERLENIRPGFKAWAASLAGQ